MRRPRRPRLPAIRFQIAGREVTQSNWHKFGPDVTEEKLDAIAESIVDKVAALRCAHHDKTVSVLCKGRTLDTLEFYVSACCEPFAQEIIEKLSAVFPSRPVLKG